MPVVLVLAACTAITGDFSPVVSIAYTGPSSPELDEGDTLTLTAVALDASGDSLDVPVIWKVVTLDPQTVPFTIDSLAGLITGLFGGSAQVRGSADGLYTAPLTVTVLGVADSIAVIEPSVVTVDTGVTVSAPLAVTIYDLPPGGDPTPVGSRPIRFSVVQPAPGTPEASQLAIGPSGGEPGEDSLTVVLTSSGSGVAAVTARRVGLVQPDTAIIEAIPLSTLGDALPVTPARFIVLFAAP